MRYKLLPGVVLTEVCGESMLIATRPARGKCDYVRHLNPSAAFFWKLLEQHADTEEMLRAAQEAYGVEEQVLRTDLQRFLESLEKQGYLTPEKLS